MVKIKTDGKGSLRMIPMVPFLKKIQDMAEVVPIYYD